MAYGLRVIERLNFLNRRVARPKQFLSRFNLEGPALASFARGGGFCSPMKSEWGATDISLPALVIAYAVATSRSAESSPCDPSYPSALS